jgi:hypothetical protein
MIDPIERSEEKLRAIERMLHESASHRFSGSFVNPDGNVGNLMDLPFLGELLSLRGIYAQIRCFHLGRV